jgi:hypothetical protein
MANSAISRDRKSAPSGGRRTGARIHLLTLTGLISACGGGSGNSPSEQPMYTIGGSVTGLLAGGSLVLQENGGGNTTVSANGNFTLPTPLGSGATFIVTVLSPPSGEGCSVANRSGTIAAGAVNNIAVTCAAANLALLAGNTGGAGNADATESVARFNFQYAVPGDSFVNRYRDAYGQGAIAVDAGGNVLIADSGNHTVRQINPAGVVTTVAGKAGVAGSIDGAGSDARFHNPTGIAIDGNGNAYIADSGNQVIRKISPGGTVSTFAGTAGVVGSSDGSGAAASFHLEVEEYPATSLDLFPSGRGALTVDGNGNVFVADCGNSTIRKITPAGMVSTLAGTAGVAGESDGTGAAATFACPSGVTTDKAGNVYVADSEIYNPQSNTLIGATIRLVTPSGAVTTLAGTPGTVGTGDGVGAAASFGLPTGVASDGLGNIYVADNYGDTIRRISPGGMVSTFAGSADSPGSVDGTGADARFNAPSSLASDGTGNIYSVDVGNNAVRVITPAGVVTTLAGAAAVTGAVDGDGSGAVFNSPVGVTSDSAGNLYVADSGNNLIRKVTLAGTVSTFAGTAGHSGSSDGTAATFFNPTGVTTDAAGNVYVADSYNQAIRKITSAGVVSTIAGNPTPGGPSMGGSADGTGSNATFQLSVIPFPSPTSLNVPTCHGGVAADATGNLYVADCGNDTIRKITASGVVTTLAGVAGAAGSADGTGPGAHFSNPTGVATDGAGNIYVADAGNNTIRKITPGGVVTTLAGTAGITGSADGTGATASFNDPESVTVDDLGDVYVADTGNSTVRKITTAGVVTTVLGVPGVVSFSPGSLPGLLSSPVGVTISGSFLFVTTGNGIAIATDVP